MQKERPCITQRGYTYKKENLVFSQVTYLFLLLLLYQTVTFPATRSTKRFTSCQLLQTVPYSR